MEHQDRYIVVGMDFTAPSIAATQWTRRHILQGERLVLAHAISIPEPPGFLKALYPPVGPLVEDARRGAAIRLSEVSATLGEQIVCPEIRVGRPDEVLGEVATWYGADLLVVGPHSDRPGLGVLIGSTAERAARQGLTSVLVARGRPEGMLQTVLVAIEESDLTGDVLAWAARLSRRSGVAIVVMHVVNPLLAGAVALGAASTERRRAEERLYRTAQHWMRGRLAAARMEQVDTQVTFGDPGVEILAAADRLKADLTILGRSAPGRGRSGEIGSTAAFVMRNGTGSVLLVAPQAAAQVSPHGSICS